MRSKGASIDRRKDANSELEKNGDNIYLRICSAMLYTIDMNHSKSDRLLGDVKLPPDLVDRVNRIAAEQQCPASEIIRMAILIGLMRIKNSAKNSAPASARARLPGRLSTHASLAHPVHTARITKKVTAPS